MAEKKLIKALLNEKDLCTDWIECEIYHEMIIDTPEYNHPKVSILGFFRKCLVKTTWKYNSNYLECHFLYNNVYPFNEEDLEALNDIIRNAEKETEGLVVKYQKISLIDGDVLLRFKFFFEDE